VRSSMAAARRTSRRIRTTGRRSSARAAGVEDGRAVPDWPKASMTAKAGSLQRCSPDAAQRNPGIIPRTRCPWLSRIPLCASSGLTFLRPTTTSSATSSSDLPRAWDQPQPQGALNVAAVNRCLIDADNQASSKADACLQRVACAPVRHAPCVFPVSSWRLPSKSIRSAQAG
jgi:hypothetical protein